MNAATPDTIAPLIAGLHAASWKVAYRGIFADAYLDGAVEAERLGHWQRRVPELVAGNGEIFLARLGQEAVGFVCVEIGPEREWGAFVDNLHMLPRLRGRRIGALLLARAAEWARAHGESQLYLWVFEANQQARRFYEREGWHAAERQIQEIPGGGERPVAPGEAALSALSAARHLAAGLAIFHLALTSSAAARHRGTASGVAARSMNRSHDHLTPLESPP